MSIFHKASLPAPGQALPGRSREISLPDRHFVNGHPLKPPFPDGIELTYFGMGCFWGAERLFWKLPGVYSTAVGYGGGQTPNPSYEEVCSGLTGHAELVMVAFDPAKIGYPDLLKPFWEEHDPTQGMRQGNDVGTQYRSVLFCSSNQQLEEARSAGQAYQAALAKKSKDWTITTEITLAPPFYYAEAYHQQYLAKNPNGYCGLRGTGIACKI
jgi:peptide-methionine (S)-S-oxide reductase